MDKIQKKDSFWKVEIDDSYAMSKIVTKRWN